MVFGHSMRAVIRDLAAVMFYELSKLRSALIASYCLPPTPQLASRHAIYRLILEHEARRALHCKQRRVEQRRVEQLGCPDDDADGAHDGAHLFESVLFMRPDLAILVPLLPYCFHPLDTARRMGDWIVWMPRGALDGAFGRALDVFRSCAVRFERGSEKLFDELAASSNVSFRAREPPVQLVLPPQHARVHHGAPPYHRIRSLPPSCRVVCLSATVPNPLECASWIGRTKQRLVHVITTEKRPTPLRHCLYAGGRLWQLVGEDRSFDHATYAQVITVDCPLITVDCPLITTD